MKELHLNQGLYLFTGLLFGQEVKCYSYSEDLGVLWEIKATQGFTTTAVDFNQVHSKRKDNIMMSLFENYDENSLNVLLLCSTQNNCIFKMAS